MLITGPKEPERIYTTITFILLEINYETGVCLEHQLGSGAADFVQGPTCQATSRTWLANLRYTLIALHRGNPDNNRVIDILGLTLIN